jgi:hypothetical protein
MIYLILIVLSIIMVGATFCTLSKVGEKEGICKYRKDDKR